MAAKKPAAAKKTPAKTTQTRTSPVRNSPIPKKVSKPVAGKGAASAASMASPIAKAAVTVTHDMIARRAHEIAQSAHSGSDLDNWLRAERELRGA